jgi:hypothetical protein
MATTPPDSRALQPSETELQSGWVDLGTRIIWDEVHSRISHLVRERLEKVAAAEDGASHLFRDPADGRYWELSYPEGRQDGTGPRRLRVLTAGEAAKRYRVPTA